MKSGKQASTSRGSKGKQPSLPQHAETQLPLQPSNGATTTSAESTMLKRAPVRLGYRSAPYPKTAPPTNSRTAVPRRFKSTLLYSVDAFSDLPDANIVIVVAATQTAYKCLSGNIKLFLPGLVDIYNVDRYAVSPEGLPVFPVHYKNRVIYPLLLLAHGLGSPSSCVDDRDHLFEILRLGLKRGSSELRLSEFKGVFVTYLDKPASLDICAGFVDSTRWELGKELVGKATLRLSQDDMDSLAATSRFFCPQGPLGRFRAFAIEDLAGLMYIHGGLHIPFLTQFDFVWFRCNHGKRKTIFVGITAVQMVCTVWFYDYCSTLIDALSKRPTHQNLSEHIVEHIGPACQYCDRCEVHVGEDLLRFNRLFAAHIKERVQALSVTWV